MPRRRLGGLSGLGTERRGPPPHRMPRALETVALSGAEGIAPGSGLVHPSDALALTPGRSTPGARSRQPLSTSPRAAARDLGADEATRREIETEPVAEKRAGQRDEVFSDKAVSAIGSPICAWPHTHEARPERPGRNKRRLCGMRATGRLCPNRHTALVKCCWGNASAERLPPSEAIEISALAKRARAFPSSRRYYPRA